MKILPVALVLFVFVAGCSSQVPETAIETAIAQTIAASSPTSTSTPFPPTDTPSPTPTHTSEPTVEIAMADLVLTGLVDFPRGAEQVGNASLFSAEEGQLLFGAPTASTSVSMDFESAFTEGTIRLVLYESEEDATEAYSLIAMDESMEVLEDNSAGMITAWVSHLDIGDEAQSEVIISVIPLVFPDGQTVTRSFVRVCSTLVYFTQKAVGEADIEERSTEFLKRYVGRMEGDLCTPSKSDVVLADSREMLAMGATLPTYTPQPERTDTPDLPEATRTPSATNTPGPDMGKWVVRTGTSEFDDSTSVTMFLEADRAVSGRYDTETPVLVVRCLEGQVESYVNVKMSANPERGLFRAVTVRLRFDDTEAFDSTVNESTDGEALFFQGVSIINQMFRNDSLLFGFTPFNSEPVATTFDLKGFGNAAQDLRLACPGQIRP